MSMVGVMRMGLLHVLLHAAYQERRLSGDFLEAGVWRGGSCIHAKGFLEAYKLSRQVWVPDSFRLRGLPRVRHPKDSV